MAAPKGNQFWKLRSKHGRDALFATPEVLWEAATEYFEWVDAHPWWRNEPIKSGEMAGTSMKVYTARPYTIEGVTDYLNASKSYWRHFRRLCEEQKREDFISVIERVDSIIYRQKYEGAAVGAFNANLIARDLGLKERSEVTGADDAPLFPEKGTIDIEKLTPDLLKALYNSMQKDEPQQG